MRNVLLAKPDWVQTIESEIATLSTEAVCRGIRERISHLNLSDDPEFSILIPAFNEQNYLLYCLNAIACLQTRRDLEIIVIDNASTDQTAALAEACGVRVVQESKQGIQFARQRGLDEAQAEVVCWTEADSLVPPGWIDAIADQFDQDPELIGLVGDIQFINPRLRLHLYRLLVERAKAALRVRDFCHGQLLHTGANLSYKKQAACRIGGYDPKVSYGEDSIIIEKLNAHGKLICDYRERIRVCTSCRRLNQEPILRLFKTMLVNRYRRHVLGETREQHRKRNLGNYRRKAAINPR